MNNFAPELTADELLASFPGYKDFRYIAEGGQGIVLKAHGGNRNALEVALKIYFPGSLEERNEREIEALRTMTCENIVGLHEAGSTVIRENKCLYVVTDFIEGLTVSSLIKKSKMDEGNVVRLGINVARAIEHIWQKRIVHRDIKPDNIMSRIDGRNILIDLGIARHMNLSSLTTMGKTWGTEGYMSPEHARAYRQLSCKTDVFSLGIVLQEALIGLHPTGRDQRKLLFGGMQTAGIAPWVSREVREIIDLMLSRNPEDRPSPSSIVADLSEMIV